MSIRRAPDAYDYSVLPKDEKLLTKDSLLHAAHVMGPTLAALMFAAAGSAVAHAHGTMDFSGAATLMDTFKTFAKYPGAVTCLDGLIFALRSNSHDDLTLPGCFGAFENRPAYGVSTSPTSRLPKPRIALRLAPEQSVSHAPACPAGSRTSSGCA